MTRITTVLFDIGNVLIGWQPERFYDREFGPERRKDLFARVDLHGMNDRVDRGEDFRETVYRTAREHPDLEFEIRQWHDRWLDLAGPVIDSSVMLMRRLREKGVPVMALSNFGVGSFRLAQGHFDFLNEFDRLFVSGHMGVIKPETAIYQQVEAACGQPPASLFFTDDRPDNIAAAQARGWTTHLFEGPEGLARKLVALDLLTPADLPEVFA